MTGVVLLAFFAYLYLPHVLFKAAAQLYVDLGKKQDASQLEEIASAVLPSAILHGLTYLALKALAAAFATHLPGVNWLLVTSLASTDAQHLLASPLAHVDTKWTLVYAAFLAALAIGNGLLYGKARFSKVILTADGRLYPGAAAVLESKRWRATAFVAI